MSLGLPKAILFDMGDTLIHEDPPDFEAGTRVLLEIGRNPRGAAAEDILALASELTDGLLAAREASLMEFSCMGLQRLLYDRFGVTFDQSPLDVEHLFRRTAFHSTVAPGIEPVLEDLANRGIRRAVLSNSIFTAATLEHDLEHLGLRHWFEFVMASVDYCIRKPHPALFLAAAGRLDLPPGSIWFAGDHWECDIGGAHKAGMPAVWYNPARKPCPGQPKPAFQVHAWEEFPALLNEPERESTD